MSLDGKIDYLQETKQLLKQAIEAKGQEIGENDTFRSYADKIASIETGEAKVFSSVEEMEAHTDLPNNTKAIVFNINYEGTYELIDSVWVSVGVKVNNLEAFQALENLFPLEPEEHYEGLGGTEEEIEEILDEIIGKEE